MLQLNSKPAVAAEAAAVLALFTRRVSAILGKNLVGIYVYGSLTQNAFNPTRSDLDCLVVTQREVSDAQFRRLGDWFGSEVRRNPWIARLQAQFLLRDQVLTMDAKACLFQFGEWKRSGSDGNPIIWLNVLDSGLVLAGPPAGSFVPPITRGVLHQALVREVEYLRAEVCLKPDSQWRNVPRYRAYAVLTLCRVLYTAQHGTVISKPRAAQWALEQLRPEWHDLIRRAIGFDQRGEPGAIPVRRLARMISDVRRQLARNVDPLAADGERS